MFPNTSTIEAALTFDDKYTFYYKGKRCCVWLDKYGLFGGQADKGLLVHGEDVRGVMDKLYQQLRG